MTVKLILGDCLIAMKDIPDKSIDLILTDPPYGIDYQSNMRTKSPQFNKIENDNNSIRFLAFKEFFRLLKDNSALVSFCSYKNYHEDYIEISRYFNIKNCIIWNKGGGGIGDLEHSLSTDYEMAIVAHKGQCKIRGKRHGSVWTENKVNPNDMTHPTEKPVNLMNRILNSFSDSGGLVIDPFMGSGTTGVAAVKLDRHFIGIEIDPKYFAIAEKRIKEEEAKLKLF